MYIIEILEQSRTMIIDIQQMLALDASMDQNRTAAGLPTEPITKDFFGLSESAFGVASAMIEINGT